MVQLNFNIFSMKMNSLQNAGSNFGEFSVNEYLTATPKLQFALTFQYIPTTKHSGSNTLVLEECRIMAQ